MSDTKNDAVSSALEQALRTIDRLKAAMGEEWLRTPAIERLIEKSAWDDWAYCVECKARGKDGHSKQCTRGRFFAALKEMDDAE